jgi:hypothetical protein
MLPGAPFRGVNHVEHSIETGDAKPHTPYSHSPVQLQLIKREIQKMVEQNILEPSTSPWGAPCLLVKKKTEHGLQVTPRLVWDYRKLNKVTKPDVTKPTCFSLMTKHLTCRPMWMIYCVTVPNGATTLPTSNVF